MDAHKIVLTLSTEQLDHASEALSDVARTLRKTPPHLSLPMAAKARLDAEILEHLAAQLEVARLEADTDADTDDDGIPVELVFSSLGEKGAA